MPTKLNKNSTKKDETTKSTAKKTSSKAILVKEETKKMSKKKTAKDSNKTVNSKTSVARQTKTTAKVKATKAAKTTKATKATKSVKESNKASATPKKSVKKDTSVKEKSNKSAVSLISEYFDLPDNYNKTTVKVLFQTPKKLFVYWEISENDRKRLINENGKDFFENSTPFLVIHNLTKSYSFEIQINDYANSWYFDIPDSHCEYQVELIRKYNNTPIQITTSNDLEVPSNHILFEENRKEIFFKNVKTSYVSSKSIVSLHFINHIGVAQPVTINAFYNKFYNEKDLYYPNNPSSGL